jgi:hypothetical protein
MGYREVLFCPKLTLMNAHVLSANGRTRSDVELGEWAAIDRSASGRTRPSTDTRPSDASMAVTCLQRPLRSVKDGRA